MLKEFKAFVMRGNVVDLAVGVIIGGAFGGIVSSLVTDILMPPLGLLTGGIDFKDLYYPLDAKAKAATSLATMDKGAVVIRYGLFINTVISFLLISAAIFIVVKLMAKLYPPPPPPPPASKDCPQCAMAVPIKAVKCGHCQSAL